LYGELRDQGLQVVLVNFREDAALVRRTVRERGYAAPVLLDLSGEVTGRAYGVFGPPTVYFVDRQGRLLGRAAGPRDWGAAAGRRFVEALLTAPGGS
jgi:hypothetical protein